MLIGEFYLLSGDFFLCLPKLGRVESVSLLACPGWGLKNRFYFLLAQIGDGRIGFTSCLPMLGIEESVLLLACPSWAEKNRFYFLFANDGQRGIFFLSVWSVILYVSRVASDSFEYNKNLKKTPRYADAYRGVVYCLCSLLFCLRTYFAISIATATCTVAPTIGLLPIPMNPIIST